MFKLMLMLFIVDVLLLGKGMCDLSHKSILDPRHTCHTCHTGTGITRVQILEPIPVPVPTRSLTRAGSQTRVIH